MTTITERDLDPSRPTALISGQQASAAGVSAAVVGFDAFDAVYVEAKFSQVPPLPPINPPSIELVVEHSDDGSAWTTAATFSFTAGGDDRNPTDMVSGPKAFMRVSWAPTGGSWEFDVTVRPTSVNEPGGPGGPSAAEDVSYDNGESGLDADDVQAAIDELAAAAPGGSQSGAHVAKSFLFTEETGKSEYEASLPIGAGAIVADVSALPLVGPWDGAAVLSVGDTLNGPGSYLNDVLLGPQPAYAITAIDRGGPYPIIGVSVEGKTFTIDGDHTAPGFTVARVRDSTGNDLPDGVSEPTGTSSDGYGPITTTLVGGDTVISTGGDTPASPVADGTISYLIGRVSIVGNHVAEFSGGDGSVTIADSTGNDGTYSVVAGSVSFDGTHTHIWVYNPRADWDLDWPPLPSSVADGTISPPALDGPSGSYDPTSVSSDNTASPYSVGNQTYSGASYLAGYAPGVYYADADEITIRVSAQSSETPQGVLLVTVIYFTAQTPTAADAT